MPRLSYDVDKARYVPKLFVHNDKAISLIFVLDLNLMMAGETAKNVKNDVPYGFIVDDGKQGRHGVVTMRSSRTLM